jgi:hypothetical protein
MFKWAKEKFNPFIISKDDIPEGYKICPECAGTGHEDIFSKCEICHGDGIIRKTYQEYLDSLPPT